MATGCQVPLRGEKRRFTFVLPKSEGGSAWPELGHMPAGSKQRRVGGGGGEGQVQRGLHLDKKDGAGLSVGGAFPIGKNSGWATTRVISKGTIFLK